MQTVRRAYSTGRCPASRPRLDAPYRAALATQIESGFIPTIHDAVRWRVIDLCQWLFEEHKVSVAKQAPSCELRQDGLLARSAMIPLRWRKVGRTCCRQNTTNAMTSLGRQVRLRMPLLRLLNCRPQGRQQNRR